MKKPVRFICAALALFTITLIQHLAVSYVQCPARFDVMAVVVHHAAAFAAISAVVAFAILAAKCR